MKTAIRGIGVVGAFGCGTQDFLGALSTGTESITFGRAPFGNECTEWPVYRADPSPLNEFIPPRKLRRIDHHTRMGLLAAVLAMQDAGREMDKGRLGVVVATGYGATRTTFEYQDSVIDGGDIGASPTLFSHSVHNAAAANISILLGIRGPSLTVSQFELSVASALLTARTWLAEDRVDAVLLGGIDEYCDVLGYSLGRCYQNSGPPRRMKPLALDEQSAIAGEGAAFLLLTEGQAPDERYGHIRDVRVGAVPSHPVSESSPEFIILGADGDRACADGYRKLLPPAADVMVYTPLFGSFPSSQAFDMAVAALSRHQQTMFPVPGKNENNDIRVADRPTLLMDRDIRCVKVSRSGRFGDITCSI